ncbi:MAG: PQQ-binding-like beta-propeller repeat protein [Cyclobacteriaceae bacterium]|nr:PQQ-binding-like beta-propeller repeat protein [Cyclobacteriaceae bacterium]MDH4296457.1 PQQ-binding-like beta-propeller repeat protein [Cyclobacteriaceae bacterium]
MTIAKIMTGTRFFLIQQTSRYLSLFLCVATLYYGCKPDRNKYRSWTIYKADSESSSYSELSEIDKQNVNQLQVAWTFNPNDAVGLRPGNSECNPIIVDNVMYATSARHRLYAIEASTGKKIWSFDPFNGGKGGGINRGVTYWESGDDKRILYTAGNNLFAQDAMTGALIEEFGTGGKVNLKIGLRGDTATIFVIPTSPGIVYRDLLIMGAEVSELYGAEPGYIRAYNIRTGKLEWTFHTIPHPGEPGYETWPKDAWKYAGGVNDWAGMSLDEKRGMVFLALGSPSYDFYGADRIGQNLFGNSVVALDAGTGNYRWHFQTVHHDLWDYDLPAPPNLVTVNRNGKKIDAVAQTTKSGFLFVLDRETGESLFPIEERKVPASRVPGEETWPTQPFPLKPLPYARQHMTIDDLSNFSEPAHDSLVKRFNSLRYEGLFTPPDLDGTLMLPGTRGGSSWGGGAFDYSTSVLYVKSNDSPEIDHLQKVEATPGLEEQPTYFQGKAIYMSYCANCHGRDLKGFESLYPPLIGIKDKMKKEEALAKIRQGAGRMPAFAAILQGKEKAIIEFLFEKENTKPSQMESEIFEIHANKLSLERTDSADRPMYLNTTAYGHFLDIDGNPGIKPPWGTLNAINLSTGEFVWKIPLGNHPELQEVGAPQTGAAGSGGPIVTAGGLVFIGSTHDRKFRAFDKDTGDLLWETTLPGIANATPCTYWSNGKQYVAVSVSGTVENPSGNIISFALPE